MQHIDDEDLARMSSRELLDLQAQIHDAIRAHIRTKNARMSGATRLQQSGPAHLPQVEQSRQRSLLVHAATRGVAVVAAVSNSPPGTGEQPPAGSEAVELERERDAWLTRKRAKPGE